MLSPSRVPPSAGFLLLAGEVGQGREGDTDAAAAEPAVPGALRLPDPLQCLPASGEEGLLAAALQPLDARGEASPAYTASKTSLHLVLTGHWEAEPRLYFI